jgi:hypothetical protein
MPITLRGARDGAYDTFNPQIVAAVTAFNNIRKGLNEAPDQWWTEANPRDQEIILQPGQNDKTYSFAMPRETDGAEADEEEHNEDDEVMEFKTYGEDEDQDKENRDMKDLYNESDAMNGDEDSDRTELFPSHPSPDSQHCTSPGASFQSPNCSAVAHLPSQLSHDHSDVSIENVKTPRVTNLEEASVNAHVSPKQLLKDKPCVFVATPLDSDDQRLLHALEEEGHIKRVADIQQATIAVCANAVYETGEGFLIRSTYQYLLAMTHGIPLVYISLFRTQPPFCPDLKNRVIGVANTKEWFGPQRAEQAKKDNQPLLVQHTLILVGDFHVLSTRRDANIPEAHPVFSKDRIRTLLHHCGATVLELPDLDEDMIVGWKKCSSKVAVLIRPDPQTRDWRAARKAMQGTGLECTPIVSATWFIECLADYRVWPWNEYTEKAGK